MLKLPNLRLFHGLEKDTASTTGDRIRVLHSPQIPWSSNRSPYRPFLQSPGGRHENLWISEWGSTRHTVLIQRGQLAGICARCGFDNLNLHLPSLAGLKGTWYKHSSMVATTILGGPHQMWRVVVHKSPGCRDQSKGEQSHWTTKSHRASSIHLPNVLSISL